jgi:hypothetical protein
METVGVEYGVHVKHLRIKQESRMEDRASQEHRRQSMREPERAGTCLKKNQREFGPRQRIQSPGAACESASGRSNARAATSLPADAAGTRADSSVRFDPTDQSSGRPSRTAYFKGVPS